MSKRILWSLGIVLAFQGLVRAADSVFTGNLVQVAPGSISIRLADGRVVDARLPKSGNLAAEALAKEYSLADQVEITAKTIDAFLDKQRDHYYFVELKKLRLLRSSSPEELTGVLNTLWWKRGDNLLQVPGKLAPKPSLTLPDPRVERLREVNLGYVASLPNFVADERATRSLKLKDSSSWKLQDTVESEITLQSSGRSRQHVRINGKARNSQSHWLPGVNWGIGFGTELIDLFDPKCETTFDFKGPGDGPENKQLLLYSFHAPPDRCFGPSQIGAIQSNGSKDGQILVDDAGHVVQFKEGDTTLSWGYVRIGESSHLLPVAADYVFTFPDGVWHIEVQFKNHKHFESSIQLKTQ